MKTDFDVIVIGAGPGGYIAAIRAAQLGFTTACIDDSQNDSGQPALGGTCTNVGCIPSKALLQSSEHFEHASHTFVEHGVTVKGVSLDLRRMQQRKEAIIKQNNEGVLYLLKKNKVSFFHGRGSFAAATGSGYQIKVDGPGNTTLTGKCIIVATGSAPRPFPGLPFDEKTVLSNTGALALSAVPAKLGVIGAGVIGLELGSVWRRLGSEVTLFEAAPNFLPAADEQLAKEAFKVLSKQGLGIHVGVKLGSVKQQNGKVSVIYADGQGKQHQTQFDKVIVSIGRTPHTLGLNAESVGLVLDEAGFIEVDDNNRTNLPGVWAIGDVVRGPMLAHKAEEEGVAVAEQMAGQHSHVNRNVIPSVIYTHPEMAWVGQPEQQLKLAGTDYKAGVFPFAANGRARAMGDTTGMVKVLSDAATDKILGVHIIGPQASELIGQAVMAMEFCASAEDMARLCQAHPSLTEALKEAALAVDKRTLNY